MRSTAAVALILAVGLSARGQEFSPKAIQHFDDQPAPATGPEVFVKVDADADWKGWLDAKFPDASRSWPKKAAAAFAAVRSGEKWDYIGKGDLDGDGAPTGLLVRVERLPEGGRVVARALAVVEWRGGRWTELLRMDGGKGIRMNRNPQRMLSEPRFYGYTLSFYIGQRDALHPGAAIDMNVVDREGRGLAEPLGFTYLPAKKKYASLEGDGDWDAD